MKTIVAFIVGCLGIVAVQAQKTEGTITYKETIALDIDFDNMKGLTEEMKAMIPKEQSINNTLYFTPNVSLYTNAKANEDQDANYKSDDESIQIQIKMDAPEKSYYYDLKNKESIESQDLFGKKFLIAGTPKIKWKITNNTQELLGYSCKKAIGTTTDGDAIEVWFTTEIPLPIGPSFVHGLPGAVLSVTMKEGTYTIAATKVNLEKVDAKKLVKPKKGKKVSREEYAKIAEAKQKEMAEIYGGSGNVIMHTETIER